MVLKKLDRQIWGQYVYFSVTSDIALSADVYQS